MQNAIFLISDIKETGKYFRESDDSLMEDLLNLLQSLGLDTTKVEEIKYYENPFIHRNWEIHNLRFPNILAKIHVLMKQLEIKYLEECLKMNAHDDVARNHLDILRREFSQIAQRGGLAD